MTPRPRIHKLPDNLTLDIDSGRFRYRNSLTGHRTWFGKNRETAITRAKQANRAIDAIRAQQQISRDVAPTVSNVIDLYIENRVPSMPWDDGTRKNHLFALALYRREFGHRVFAAVDRIYLDNWLTNRCRTGDAFNKHRARLIDLWTYARSRKLVDYNEAQSTLRRSTSKKLKTNRKVRQRLSVEAFKTIREAAPVWLQVAMDTSLITLQARAEVVSMKRADRTGDWLRVIRDKTAADTDMAFIRIEMTGQLKEIWQRAWEDGIPCPFLVHYRPKSQRPQHMQNKSHPFTVTPDYLTKTFKAIRDETTVCNHLEPRQRPTFHEIRSLGARVYRKLGYDDGYIRALMTHTDQKTTEIYLQNPEALNEHHFRPVKAEMKLSQLPRI